MLSVRQISSKAESNYKSIIKEKNQSMDRIIYINKLVDYAKRNKIDLRLKNKDTHYFAWSLIYFLRFPTKHNFDSMLFTYKHHRNKFKMLIELTLKVDRLFLLIFKKIKNVFSNKGN